MDWWRCTLHVYAYSASTFIFVWDEGWSSIFCWEFTGICYCLFHTGSMPVRVGKYSAYFLFYPRKYICLPAIVYSILLIPWTFIWVRIYLHGCANICIPAAHIFMLLREHSGVPQSILAFPQKFIHCAKIFSDPRKHLVSPRKLLCFLRRFFHSFLFGFAGLPWLCKWSIVGNFGTVVGV